MKAMVLAAGLGTRLRPLTDNRPKALVEVHGHTLLEITLTRLKAFGIHEVIVNVHHFAEMVSDFLRSNHNFGLRVEISREDESLLDTGGGLKKASAFFLEDGTAREPFLLHNVDVISDIDFAGMISAHEHSGSLATLAVQERVTSRYLLFDRHNELCGRLKGREAPPEIVCPTSETPQALAFCGIHVISPRLLPMIEQDGVFSIIDAYLSVAAKGERISAFRADKSYWRDLGKPEDLRQVEEDLRNKTVSSLDL